MISGQIEEQIKGLLFDITQIRNLCEKRCLEKMDVMDKGFGEYNRVESVDFHEDGMSITVVDMGYDLRDIAYMSIDIDEMSMTDDQWKDHITKLKQETEFQNEEKKKKEKMEEQQRRKNKYLELKKEFENK